MSILADPIAERTTLGAVIRRPALLSSVEGLIAPQHMSERRHSLIYGAMLSMSEGGTDIDLVTLNAHLTASGDIEAAGGTAYLASLVEGLPAMTSVETWARIVRDKARRRAAIAITKRFITAAEEGEQGTEQLIDALQSGLSRLIETGERKTVRLTDVLGEAMAELDNFATAQDSVTGIPCGLIDVDRLFGGWQKGRLYIVAARPSRGKSALLAQLSVFAAMKGYKVLVFSMEMEPYQLASRMLLSEAQVDRWDLRKHSTRDLAWQKVHRAYGELEPLPLWFDPRESPDLAQTRSSAKQHQNAHGLDLVVFDYLQRATTDPKFSDNRWLAVGEIAKGLKSLSRNLKVPVIAACQLSGEAEEKRPNMAMLQQAQAIISAEADVISFLHPTDLTNWKTQPFPQIDLLVEKNRQGACMDIPLSFERASTRFVSAVNVIAPQGVQ